MFLSSRLNLHPSIPVPSFRGKADQPSQPKGTLPPDLPADEVRIGERGYTTTRPFTFLELNNCPPGDPRWNLHKEILDHNEVDATRLDARLKRVTDRIAGEEEEKLNAAKKEYIKVESPISSTVIVYTNPNPKGHERRKAQIKNETRQALQNAQDEFSRGRDSHYNDMSRRARALSELRECLLKNNHR